MSTNALDVKSVLLGALVALMAVLVFRSGPTPIAKAEGASSDGYMAVGVGEDLYLIDTKNQRIAQYFVSKSDGRMRLRGARNIEFDFKVDKEEGDPKGLTFEDMYKKYAKGGK